MLEFACTEYVGNHRNSHKFSQPVFVPTTSTPPWRSNSKPAFVWPVQVERTTFLVTGPRVILRTGNKKGANAPHK